MPARVARPPTGHRQRVQARAILRHYEQAVIRTVTQFHDLLVDKTPVDTTFAENSWQITIGRPRPDFITTFAGKRLRRLRRRAQAQMWRSRNARLHVSNDASYIKRLDNGYSTQAPAGFVRAALISVMATYRP